MAGSDTSSPFEEAEWVRRYEEWYVREGRRTDMLEKALLEKLLGTFNGPRSVLEVGCGTGHFTRWMAEKDVVMIASISNCCPMLTTDQDDSGGWEGK